MPDDDNGGDADDGSAGSKDLQGLAGHSQPGGSERTHAHHVQGQGGGPHGPHSSRAVHFADQSEGQSSSSSATQGKGRLEKTFSTDDTWKTVQVNSVARPMSAVLHSASAQCICIAHSM